MDSERLYERLGNDNVGRHLVDHKVNGVFLSGASISLKQCGPGTYPAIAAYVLRGSCLTAKKGTKARTAFVHELRNPMNLRRFSDAALLSLGETSQPGQKSEALCWLSAFGEVPPHKKRFVTLDQRKKDRFGRAIPVIHWEWTSEDYDLDLAMSVDHLEVAHAIDPRGIVRKGPGDGPERYVIWHEAGTLRMGRSARDSVTDSRGAFHGIRGLYAADASIMPTALDRPPTATVLALTLRVADGVIRDFRTGVVR